MTPSGHSSPVPTPGERVRTSTPADLRRRAHAKLAERIDFARSRHKPLSLLRQEARRLLEQLFDADAPTLARPDRDRLVEDVLAESPGVGPLEELFRDDAVTEVLVLAPHQVINRKAGVWLPTSARFRDAEQLRAVLSRHGAAGEPLAGGPEGTAAVDVRIPNGFRVVAVVPPDVMDHPPMALFVRGLPAAAPPPGPPLGWSGGVMTPGPRSVFTTPAPRSTFAPPPATFAPPPSQFAAPVPAVASPPPPAGSGVVSFALPRLTPADQPSVRAAQPSGVFSASAVTPDPFARTRQRVTQRIVTSLAAAGLYDLNVIPLPELRRIVLAHVGEFCDAERLDFGDADRDRLGLEILAAMNR